MDKVYDRLSAAARSARQVATEGQALYRTDRNNFVRDEDGTGMYERDVFAFQAAKRLATLDAEHEDWSSAGWTGPTVRSATSAGSVSATPITNRW